jgi:hypothetical protein
LADDIDALAGSSGGDDVKFVSDLKRIFTPAQIFYNNAVERLPL